MSAVALMSEARSIAMDPRNASLALTPTAAVAVCLEQAERIRVVPRGGRHPHIVIPKGGKHPHAV